MRRLLILLLAITVHLPLRGSSDNFSTQDILLICSHAESSDWAQDMLKPIYDLEKERSDIQVYSSFLRMTSLSGTEDLERRREEIFAAFDTRRPDLAILVGGSSYIMADDIEERWPGTPMILAGENDYYCTDEYNIHGSADPDAVRTPVSDLLRQGINLTLLYTPALVEETVDLISEMLPGMDKLLFIAGENFQCREQQVRLEKYLSTRYPHLRYEPVYSSEYTTDELIALLQAQDRSTTGILFGSWLTHKGYMQTISSRHNVTHIIEAIAPVFNLFWCDLDKNRLITGYYSYDHSSYHSTLKGRILGVLDDGMAPGDMPFVNFDKGHPTINYTSVSNFGLDPALIPHDAEIIGSPISLWSAYGRVILLIIALAVLMIFLALFLAMRNALAAQRRAREAAQQANDMKTLFIQNMSHEIRTPLNAIIGFAQLLGLPDGFNTQQEKEDYLSYVMNNSHLLTLLINDILSLSDMENGKYTINLAPCRLNDICRLAMRSVEHRVQGGVDFRFEPEIPDDLTVETDGMRVQQILINYLTNACKHTMEGSIIMSNSLEETPGYVTFAVADTGPGVPPEKAETIFERFVKLNAHKQGAGLGLNICKIIADNLGGRAWLDTSYTRGARFVFTIPCRPSSAEA